MASQSWIDKDFYGILGVSRDAKPEEIKKAYREVVREHHPDRNPSKASEERFKDVGEAYSVLSDAAKRAEYDKLRQAVSAGVPGAGFGGRGFRVTDFGFGEEFDVDDLLEQIFGGRGFGPFGRAQTGPRRGRDIETTVELAFGEACTGVERKIRLDLPGGRREVNVRIPAGVSDGSRIRVRDRGEPVEGGASGDLYVRVRVAPHPFFTRRGEDLGLTLPITYSEAALGAQVKVPTLEGAVTLKVPAGTSSGRTFRVRGHGIRRPDGTKGDLLATAQVVVPEKLSRKQRELIKQLTDEGEGSPRDHLGV